jgi:hypothetical protein
MHTGEMDEDQIEECADDNGDIPCFLIREEK